MIVPDLNLVVYAHNRDAPHHTAARAWWEGLLNSTEPVAIPWVVVLGFVRLTTHRAVLINPMSPATALAYVHAWFARAHVERLEPGPQHIDLEFTWTAPPNDKGPSGVEHTRKTLADLEDAALCSGRALDHAGREATFGDAHGPRDADATDLGTARKQRRRP